MIRRTVTVKLENGLHMVPCSEIVKSVREFPGRVVIRRDQILADARSVLDLLQLKAEHGTQLEVEAEGDHAAEIVEIIAQLFETNFEVGRSRTSPSTGAEGS